MKFNKTLLILLMILIAAITVGCSSGGTETSEKTTQASTEVASKGETITMPEERPALTGKVKEIIGNEVTVYIAQVPQNQGKPRDISNQAQPQERTQNQEKPQNQPQGQNQPQSGDGASTQNRGFAMNFTEETKTFIIPVGTPIVTMQRGSREATQVGLTEIKKDSILRVWMKDDAVSFVQVAGGNGAMGNRQGAGGTGNRTGGGGQQGMGGSPAGMGGR